MSTALPAQMRAMLTVAHGGREQLVLRDDYPVPAPAQDEVLLRVAATAVNFHDIFTRRGMPGITLPLPVVVGSDFAGEVVARGSAVETPAVGDRVLVDPVDFSSGKPCMYGEVLDGGRAEYVAVKASLCVSVPAAVTLEQAAALPLAYGTAYRMLFTQGGVGAGDRVLVLGASGGVGAACVQLAAAAGAEVIACASTDDKLQGLGAAGATHRVNYREEPFLDAVRRIYGKPRVAGDGGVTVAINFTGGDTLPDTQRCVAKGGRILCCGATAGFDLSLDARYWWTYEHRLIGSNGWSRQDLVDLLTMIAEGRLDPLIDSVLPLEQAPAAEAKLEERRVLGKLLLRP